MFWAVAILPPWQCLHSGLHCSSYIASSVFYSSDQWYLKCYREHIPTLLHVRVTQLPTEKNKSLDLLFTARKTYIPLFSNLNRIYGSNLKLHLSYLLKLCMNMFTKSLFNWHGFNLDVSLQGFFQNINHYPSEKHQASLSVPLFTSLCLYFLVLSHFFLLDFKLTFVIPEQTVPATSDWDLTTQMQQII